MLCTSKPECRVLQSLNAVCFNSRSELHQVAISFVNHAHSTRGEVMNATNQNQFNQTVLTQTTFTQTPNEKAALEYRLGFQAYALGKKDHALEHFQTATIINPSYLEAQRWLGRVALELGLGNEAQRAFETVIRFQGQTLAIMAMLEFARNVNKYGRESSEFFRAGCDQNKANNYRISCFEGSVAANPEHQQAWAWLGRMLLEARAYDGAVVACRKALALDPDDAGSAHRLRLAMRNTKSLIPLETFSGLDSVGNTSSGAP